jgi:ubiquinone/menaquinone biosynthesis C-methylase UbiE
MFTDPIKNLKALGLREDHIVADLGAGTGHYAIAAGKIVTKGKVYAVEIIKDFLTTIKNKITEAHLNNVEILWGDIEKIGGTKIKDNIVDVVIASNVLFQVENKNKFIDEIKRILKPEGRVLLVDWSTEPAGISPRGALSKDRARLLFEEKNFILEREIDAGAHHYGMILVRH